MSDPTAGLPAAGWYTDPSDPRAERWWGGLEWTDHTRPLDVAPPVVSAPLFPPPTIPAPALQPPPPASAMAQAATPRALAAPLDAAIPQFASQTTGTVPQFASQTTGAIPQFASQQPALPASPFSASQFTTIEEAAAAFGAAASSPTAEVAPWNSGGSATTGSPWETAPSASPYAFGATSQPAASWDSSPSTYSNEPQSNVPAVVGFILSLLGFGLISLIISVVGAKKATRYVDAGEAPKGRAFARWGIGLSIAGMIGGLIWIAFFAYTLYLAGTLGAFDNVGANPDSSTSETTDLTEDSSVSTDPIVPAVPGQNPVADEIAAGMADSMDFFYDAEAQSVICPADATNTAGSVVNCDIVLVDGRELRGEQTFTAEGSSTQYFEK